MNKFALEIFDDEGQVCTFYTVRWLKDEVSETDKFFVRYKDNERLKEYLQQLAKFLEITIGNVHGAKEYFFRSENKAQALPPSGQFKVEEVMINFRQFPLRLYCMRMNKGLVILFNGGEKTSQKAQEGDTRIHFSEANNFAHRIMEALREGEILYTDNDRRIKQFNNKGEIII